MDIVWTAQGEADRKTIVDYIAARDPAAAQRIDQRLGEAVGRLADFPFLGRVGAIAGTRELIPHPSYRIVYATSARVIILAVVHTARHWPPAASEEE